MSLPQTMRGVRIHKQGQPADVQVEEKLLLPAVRDTDVLIKVEYSGVNFIDVYQRQGVYPVQTPITAGREGAGTIVKLGPKVPAAFELQVGDRVAVFTQGTMAEYVAAPAEGVMKLADGISTKTGAAIMLQGLTAWTMVNEAHEVAKDQTILVQAAAGGTGGLVVQMCKHLGATVIGTVSTPEKAKIATAHGCDHIILYKDASVQDEVMRITDGKGCHGVFSGVGKSTFAADLACTRRKGTLVSYGNSSGVVADFRILDLSKKNVKLVRPTLANYITERHEFLQRAKELQELLKEHSVKVQHGGEYSLDTMLQAQDDLASQATTGKLLVKI